MLGPYYGERYGNRGLTAYDPYRRGDLTAPTVWPTDLINFGDMGQLRNFNKSMSSILSADLIDKGNSYEVHVDLPGIAKEDLEVNIADDSVNIKGVRRQMHEVDSEFTHKIERTFGKVERTLRLPKDADGTKAIAKFEGGVLLVTFPKIPGIESGAKRITIT